MEGEEPELQFDKLQREAWQIISRIRVAREERRKHLQALGIKELGSEPSGSTEPTDSGSVPHYLV